jgi:sporulation protein YlmC with PRC-barrel domain
MASDNMKHRRLQELGESDFEIVEGQPDIRGWDVRNERDQKIGEVEELILDAKNKKVRYLVVDLDDNDFDLDDKEVLIPIGMAELHEEDDDVVVRGVGIEQLEALPEYDDDNLTPDVERKICMSLGRSKVTTSSLISENDQDLSFYNEEHFNDANIYRRRLPSSTSSDPSLKANPETGTDTDLKSGNKYDFSRGYGLREIAGTSGTEVEGYMGNQGVSYGSQPHPASRGSMYQQEEINEEEAMHVSTPRNTPEEKNWSKETDIDNLTGDSNSRLRGDDLRRNEDDEIRRSER